MPVRGAILIASLTVQPSTTRLPAATLGKSHLHIRNPRAPIRQRLIVQTSAHKRYAVRARRARFSHDAQFNTHEVTDRPGRARQWVDAVIAECPRLHGVTRSREESGSRQSEEAGALKSDVDLGIAGRVPPCRDVDGDASRQEPADSLEGDEGYSPGIRADVPETDVCRIAVMRRAIRIVHRLISERRSRDVLDLLVGAIVLDLESESRHSSGIHVPERPIESESH